MKRTRSYSIDLQHVTSVYIHREETCYDKMFKYFWYYCCCGFRAGI